MSTSADAILFDLFGVIARNQSPLARKALSTLAGVAAPAFWDAYWKHRAAYDRAEVTATEYWHQVAAILSTSFDERRITALIAADLASWSTVDDDMITLIRQTVASGRRVALLSNIPEDLALHYEHHHNRWLSQFEVVAFSCRTGLSKPDPAAYQWCCRALGLAPENILFIDDRAENVAAAERLGMRTHRFTSRDGAARAIAGTPTGHEPPDRPWTVAAVGDVLRALFEIAGDPPGRPRIIAIDGRSGVGKTTVAAILAAAVPDAAIVHTDDVAWHHSSFDWSNLLADNVLHPLHHGQTVFYRPAAWEGRDRAGAITISADAPLVIVEGVGAARRELMSLLDAVVWVQSDPVEAEQRCLQREGSTQAARDFWTDWQAEEVPFLSAQRPWERADLVIAGTPTLHHDPSRQLVVAEPSATTP